MSSTILSTSNPLMDLLEPKAITYSLADRVDPVAVATISSAISLKRIADLLTSKDEIQKTLDMIAQHPINAYGEGLVDGIQNAIERGQRGINTNG